MSVFSEELFLVVLCYHFLYILLHHTMPIAIGIKYPMPFSPESYRYLLFRIELYHLTAFRGNIGYKGHIMLFIHGMIYGSVMDVPSAFASSSTIATS